MTTEEALDLALEALEVALFHVDNQGDISVDEWIECSRKARAAITAIKQARSAPVQEPVSDDEITAWAERHDIQGTQTDLRCMFEDAASFTAQPAAFVQEPESFEQWNAKQHGDPEEIGFLQALRIAYCSGQDSVTKATPPAQPAPVQTNCRHCGGPDNVLCAGQCKQALAAPVAQDVQEKCRIEVVPAKGGLLPAAQRQSAHSAWVGLTDEDRADAWRNALHEAAIGESTVTKCFARVIENKLKEKNT